MSRFSKWAALAASAAIVASSGASARTNHNGVHNGAQSDMDIRQQCYAEAKERWPTTNQDMQTNRDFAYRTCAFDHGVRNP